MTEWQKPPGKLLSAILSFLASLPVPLIAIRQDDQGAIVRSTNLTVLNLWLVWFGPQREDKLAIGITGAQLVVGIMGLFVRHKLALLVFKRDNRL